ncbi:MAG: creatininase family protein [Pseudomonadota bacterium]
MNFIYTFLKPAQSNFELLKKWSTISIYNPENPVVVKITVPLGEVFQKNQFVLIGNSLTGEYKKAISSAAIKGYELLRNSAEQAIKLKTHTEVSDPHGQIVKTFDEAAKLIMEQLTLLEKTESTDAFQIIIPLQLDTSIQFKNMTSLQIKKMLEAGWKSVIVPSGAIEQHGPHLPMNTDIYLATVLSNLIAQELGMMLVSYGIAPGCSDNHLPFAGTLSLDQDTFKSVLKRMTRNLISHGFKEIIHFPFHGGNFNPTQEAIRELRAEFETQKIKIIGPKQGSMDKKDFFNTLESALHIHFPDKPDDWHAGCIETSMMLYADPFLVRKELVEVGYTGKPIPSEIVNREGLNKYTANGIWGDPVGYSIELGALIFRKLIARAIQHIESERNKNVT